MIRTVNDCSCTAHDYSSHALVETSLHYKDAVPEHVDERASIFKTQIKALMLEVMDTFQSPDSYTHPGWDDGW